MKKSRTSQSLLMACLATTAFFTLGDARAKDSAADPSLYFYPATKWAVSTLDSPSGTPKCSIFSEFNNGYVVEFIGDAKSFTALNIDFRQDTFEKNKIYAAKVNVPGIAKANISAKAYESNAITADLREKTDFTKSIINASVMDLDVEGNAFRFYMTGLSASLKDYNHCTGAKPLDQEIALEDQMEKTIATTPAVHPTKKINEGAENIKTEAVALASPKKSAPEKPLPKKMPDLPPVVAVNKVPTIQEKPKPAAMNANKQETSEEALEHIYGSVKATETKKIPVKLEAQEIKAPEKPSKPEAKAEITEQESGKGWFSSLFGTSDEPEVESSKTEEKLASIQKPEVKKSPVVQNYRSPPAIIKKSPPVKIEADFTNISDEPIHTAKPEKLEKQAKTKIPPIEEIAAIEPAAAMPVAPLDDQADEIAALKSQIKNLKAENASLQTDMNETLNETRQEQISVSTDNWNLERATMKFNEAERQIERLGRQLQTQKTSCEVEKKELEGMLFDPQVTDQEQLAKLAALEADLEKAKADLLRQKRSYDEKITILEDQLSSQ